MDWQCLQVGVCGRQRDRPASAASSLPDSTDPTSRQMTSSENSQMENSDLLNILHGSFTKQLNWKKHGYWNRVWKPDESRNVGPSPKS